MTEPRHRADVHPVTAAVRELQSEAALTTDARNRAVRTFVTGLAIDVAVGVALVLTTYFANRNAWGEVEWTILSFSVAKSVVQAVGAFVLRRFLDASKVPTPLPPGEPGDPDEAP